MSPDMESLRREAQEIDRAQRDMVKERMSPDGERYFHQHTYVYIHSHEHIHAVTADCPEIPDNHNEEHPHAFVEGHSHGEHGMTPHSHKEKASHDSLYEGQHHDPVSHVW